MNLFNPYVNEPNGILKGHSRIVLAVKFMPSRSQLVSFSADKILSKVKYNRSCKRHRDTSFISY